jgi:hypothetical protein
MSLSCDLNYNRCLKQVVVFMVTPFLRLDWHLRDFAEAVLFFYYGMYSSILMSFRLLLKTFPVPEITALHVLYRSEFWWLPMLFEAMMWYWNGLFSQFFLLLLFLYAVVWYAILSFDSIRFRLTVGPTVIIFCWRKGKQTIEFQTNHTLLLLLKCFRLPVVFVIIK